MTTEDNNFLQDYLKNKSEIISTPITYDYISLTKNWFLSLKKLNLDNQCLIIALDNESYVDLKNNNIPVIKSIFDVKKSSTIEEWRVKEKKFKFLDILNIVKQYDINMIHCEVDVILLKNPIEKIKQEIKPDYDICVVSDRRFNDFHIRRNLEVDSHIDRNTGMVHKYGKSYWVQYGIENFAFSYIPKTKKNLHFWDQLTHNEEYLKKFDVEGYAGSSQTILIHAIKNYNMKIKCLSPFEFANGTVWDLSYLRNRIKNTAYLIHYNTAEGKTPEESKNMKIEKMKKHNHWFLD
jgi:hypothetical protein